MGSGISELHKGTFAFLIKENTMSKFPWMYAIIFCTAWALVGLDVQQGDLTVLGSIASVWLTAQVIGLALHKLHLNISERRFWRVLADAPDGSINSAGRRRWAWFWYEVLSHFSLLRYDVEVRSAISLK